MRNILKYLSLVPIVLFGAGCESDTNTKKPEYISEPGVQGPYFTDWGFVDELKMSHGAAKGGIHDDLEISLGDMDGDGDLDIVVGSRVTGLKIYENRIPQENK